MLQEQAKVGKNGRVLIPAEMRRALGLEGEDTVLLQVEAGELRLLTMKRRLEKAQDEIAMHFPRGTRMSEKLLAERREEARRERSAEG